MTKNLPFCFCVSDLCCLFGKFRTVSVFLTEKKCSTYIFGGNLRFFDTSMRQNVLKVTIKVKTCHFEFCACVLCYFVVFYFVFVSMIIHHLQQAHRVMANINTPIEGTSMLSFKKMLPMKKKTKVLVFHKTSSILNDVWTLLWLIKSPVTLMATQHVSYWDFSRFLTKSLEWNKVKLRIPNVF